MHGSPLLKIVNVKKSFGKIQALKGISTVIRDKEIVALIGDNGAGKSTLVNILSGVFYPSEGEIYLEGKKVNFSLPLESRKAGIETVYQNYSLISSMSIVRNFYLGRELVKNKTMTNTLDIGKMEEECKKAIMEVGIDVRSVNEPVTVLSGGERQAISIGRAMYFGAKILLLDEPLAALSVREVNKVQKLIKETSKRVAILYISHNIYHVYSIADRFVILDRGIKIGEFKKKDTTVEDLMRIISTGKTAKI
ncbi:Fructose import ATP-binding protein FrcA [subsurface metagenome]